MVDSISPLTEANLIDALLASGSIPFVLEGEQYSWIKAWTLLGWRDLITTLIGHSLSLIMILSYTALLVGTIPGWFDKKLPWRKVKDSQLDKVVLLTPTTEFVRNLPGSKIPDRTDFKHMSFDYRVEVWEEVMRRSESLAVELDELAARGEVSFNCQAD